MMYGLLAVPSPTQPMAEALAASSASPLILNGEVIWVGDPGLMPVLMGAPASMRSEPLERAPNVPTSSRPMRTTAAITIVPFTTLDPFSLDM